MKWISGVFVLLVLATSLLGEPRDRVAGLVSNGATPGMGAISIIMDPNAPVADGVFAGLERELQRVFVGSIAALELITPDLDTHPVFTNDVIIVRITGNCRIDAMPPLHAHTADTLGRTMVTDGRILPFVELDCRQIAGAVRKQIVGKAEPERSRLLGRAIARILAHEIYHVLAQTNHHSPWGIAAEALSGSDLVSERLDFRLEDLENMGLIPVMATH